LPQSPAEIDPSHPGEKTASRPRLPILIPLVVATAFFMEQLDSTIITTAVPVMARTLAVTPVQMSLAVAAYVLAVAVFIPVSGWFADKFGTRLVFASALAVFTLGSVLCGLAQSFDMLVAMRVVQGLGGAMMTPVGRLILLRSFPRSELMTAMTYVTLPAILGPVIGPLAGGVLTTYLSWRWIFYVNLPFGVIGMLLAIRFVENVREARVPKFDVPGFLMIGAGLALLQFGMENVSRPVVSITTIVVTLIAAVTLLLSFGFYARRAAAPAVDLNLFRMRSFRVGTLAGGVCRVGMNGMPFLLPLMLQVGFGLSPIGSGSLTFIGSGAAILVRMLIAPTLRRHGFRVVLVSSAIVASMILAGFAWIGPQTPHWVILLCVFAFGLTRATQFMTSNTLAYSDMPDSHLSRATSLGGALQQLSVSFGVSIGAVLLSVVGFHIHGLTPQRFQEAFLLSALLPLLGIPGFMALSAQDGIRVTSLPLAEAKEQA
jgi:EmrB/QacA subfamily drug resistance transporter